MFLGGRSFELEHDGYRYPEGSCAVFYQGGFVIIGGFESRKVERWVLQEILNFLVVVRYETNGHYLGSLPDLNQHTGMQYHACSTFVSAKGEQVGFHIDFQIQISVKQGLLAAGGYSYSSNYFSTVELYLPSTNQWTNGGELPRQL